MASVDERPLALVGIMGAGKSAVAHRLGERLAVAVADLDAMIEADVGASIAELFQREGEAAFRQREGQALERALAAGARVVACGGGIVVDPRHRERLARRCRVVWLEVTPAEAARRIAHDLASRPLLAGLGAEQALSRILAEREPFYAEVADVRVATAGRTPDAVADRVLEALAD